ncbi:hypothetical protein ABK040_008726 [Willaertia magna]
MSEEEKVLNNSEEMEENEENLTEEEKKQIEKEQEEKLKQKHSGSEIQQKAGHSYLIKKDRKKFDSADYNMKKNNNENKGGDTIPKAIKKGEITRGRFGAHLHNGSTSENHQ